MYIHQQQQQQQTVYINNNIYQSIMHTKISKKFITQQQQHSTVA